ncbi:GNAT family N-acetyltransferase [Roseibium limicola]|uniref:N-acetyltransferase n=1 Tax=Roseibium limicola TaxID=2816037 RepID=A0A939EPF2_9HYPH|nr:GNAT family N-acetyltransferase [Roseibium limicola]MBO0345632.1 N-acetyltransferase [Roseibium limicola]
MKLRVANEKDLPALLEIYNQAVLETTASWTSSADSLEGRRAWLRGRREEGYPVIVAVDGTDAVQGYASFGSFRGRDGYGLTVEHSVYVKPAAQGQGLGRLLLDALVIEARQAGFHTMVGAVDASNVASLALHAKAGFSASTPLPQVGKKFGRWLDLVLVTKVLDERTTPPAA